MKAAFQVVRPIAPPLAPPPPKPEPKITNWKFPLGDKVASLCIVGYTDLNAGDMAALIEICILFQKQINLREVAEDYSI